jgi:selenocysteine lyase/cysteine desulfurase
MVEAARTQAPPDGLSIRAVTKRFPGIVANDQVSLELRPGDEVLATDLEYGACDLMWEHLCARAGARYVRAPIPLPLHRSPPP